MTPAERIQFLELQAENRELRMKNEFLGKAAAFFAQEYPVSSKYEFIDGEKANYPIVKCMWAGVSKSGFYDWRGRPASATTERRAELTVNVRGDLRRSDGTYGHRRVHAQLGRDNVAAGPELVRRVMVEGNMVACQPRPYRNTTDPDGSAGADDLVGRDFTARAPGVKFVRGHYPHPHLARLGVSGDGDRLLLQNGGRVRGGRPHAHRACHRRVTSSDRRRRDR
nr:IS3 family transposase [Candidatus Microthrix sp.]